MRQFRYLNEQAKVHLAAAQPVLSVDTKKKELVGNLANKGRAWQPNGRARCGWTCTTSPTRRSARRSPTASTISAPTPAWVVVGDDHDTAASPEIQTETLLICGARDYFWTPEMFAETALRMPHGHLVMYPDAGHAIITDHRFAGDVN